MAIGSKCGVATVPLPAPYWLVIKKRIRVPRRRYSDSWVVGSPARTRTTDKVVNSHLLYRLSYWGMW